MASSIERFLIRRAPVISVDETLGKCGKFRSRRKRVGDEKSVSKKLKRQASVDLLPAVVSESQILWTNKYKPTHIGEMVGVRDRFLEIKRYIEDWMSGDENEAVLIIGPPGVGKTCLVYAIAAELQYKIFEVNCGLADKIVYTTEKLHETIQTHQVCRTDNHKLTSVWASPDLSERDDYEVTLSSNSLILFDDVDFMVSNSVNGFWRALKNLVQESRKPIILTASRYSEHLENLMSPLRIFEMEPPSTEAILNLLVHIRKSESCEKRNVTQIPASIVLTFDGDVRRTLNEHQLNSLCLGKTKEPEEVTINDEPSSSIKCYDLLCFQDLLAIGVGVLEPNETRARFLEGRDIPFNQTINCRQVAYEYKDSMRNFNHWTSDSDHLCPSEPFLKFSMKLSDSFRKYGRFMSRQNIATEFFPYFSLINAHQNSRRYLTRGSRVAKVPIGPMDPFLVKLSVIDQANNRTNSLF